MNLFKNTALLVTIILTLSACASASRTDLRIHQINALSSEKSDDGSFKGIEFLADPMQGSLKTRVNIFYVHGIGWTENPDGDPLANDFLAGIAQAYDIPLKDDLVTNHCGADSDQRNDKHIYITTHGEVEFETALPGSHLKIDRLICMDNTIVQVDDVLEFSVYRVFWDDLFWNALQFPHVGQDDDSGSSVAIAQLRRKYNRKLKDELVNYGFSDAIMYLGPAGAELRRAVQGAMCSAALDASGFNFSEQGYDVSYKDACALASWREINTNQFAFVTESLGSKITFDVIQDSLTDGVDNVIDEMIAGSEFYMLANQIPLLSLNDFNTKRIAPVKQFTPQERPKIIAMSELNDFLTYELVPFYEHLYKLTNRGPTLVANADNGARLISGAQPGTPESRAAIVEAIGFDIVDMRLEFADRLVPLLDSFVDPLQAHGGHASEPLLMRYILCGANNGGLNDNHCLAADLADTNIADTETPDIKVSGTNISDTGSTDIILAAAKPISTELTDNEPP